MLSAFRLVLIDLWRFLWGQTVTLPTELPSALAPLPLPAQMVPPLLSQQNSLAETKVTLPTADRPERSGTLVVVEAAGTPLYRFPHVAFDGALTHLPYGQLMQLRSYEGRFAAVLVRGQLGYVLKDATTTAIDQVWPRLSPGYEYLAESSDTSAIRRLLGDLFLAGQLCLPLQAGEYVVYRLLSDQVRIVWPEPTLERRPGVWHQLLKGSQGIHIGVTPKTDSIMEWIAEDGDGRLGYVEAVLPDMTLQVGSVGIVTAGEYTLTTIAPEVWREWRPVFISVST